MVDLNIDESQKFEQNIREVNEKLRLNPKKTILVFDIDGTLTPSRNPIKEDMINSLKSVSEKLTLCAVGGSDISKIKEQLGDSTKLFEYVFSENGLVSFHKEKLFHTKKINEYLGEDKQLKLINFLLSELAEIEIPKKRGTFIEYRTGMFNVSPIGRNCSQQERDEFVIYDKEHKIVSALRNKTYDKFGKEYNLICSIGGQISFDIMPVGWDKSYSLQFIEKDYENIIFFGDKIYDGGNDYEIAIDNRVFKYFQVKNPSETMEILNRFIKELS